MISIHHSLAFAKDLIITLLFWIYFTIGYVVFFLPFYILSLLIVPKRAILYQALNSYFFRIFFFLMGVMIPKARIQISREIRSLKSSVVIANHRSYLDPLLLMSQFTMHKTIVKGLFFKIPIFGWVLKLSGYLPFYRNDDNNRMMSQLNDVKQFLASGGILFIFPEGTRRTDGSIGAFKTGAFRIAKICKASLAVVCIRNTEKLFRPGKFLLNTGEENRISLDLLRIIEPDSPSAAQSTVRLMKEIRAAYAMKMKELC
jgi:1-acyl-sn-glycerol-3-phosphate acyltransferase